jgi:Tol biopolymer transport system component
VSRVKQLDRSGVPTGESWCSYWRGRIRLPASSGNRQTAAGPRNDSTTGAHVPSSWSRDGKTIAFVSDDDLWTLSLEDLKIERLTETPSDELYPDFSADGNWLAPVEN